LVSLHNFRSYFFPLGEVNASFSNLLTRKASGARSRSSNDIAGDENWPRGLTLPQMLIAYENGYQFVSRKPEAKEIIEENGFYHPSVFHTLGARRIYVGPGYNRTPPSGTPLHTFNLFKDLQPIPARTSPSIMIPVEPTYIPETPEARAYFRHEPEHVHPPLMLSRRMLDCTLSTTVAS
jgi:hypothetical protein